MNFQLVVPDIAPNDVRVVEGTLNSTSVMLAWSPVDKLPGVNGFFTGYQVNTCNFVVPVLISSSAGCDILATHEK